LAACGGDDDTPSGSSTPTFGGVTVVVGTGSPDGGDDSADGDPVTFEEVGRASFTHTHTIVGGDFLRSIADTYDVEIDDIVAANRWQDGREHLLLPGDEIELQADAVEPPETTESTVYQTEERADGDVEQVCSGGQMFHDYTASNDTLEVVANRLGVAAVSTGQSWARTLSRRATHSMDSNRPWVHRAASCITKTPTR